MSDMARIALELGLRADANWFHDARRTTGINNRQTGPQHDKRNCKGTASRSVHARSFTTRASRTVCAEVRWKKFLPLISRADIASG
jgi:hypothetical protein